MRPTLRFSISAQKDTETFFRFARDAEYDGGRTFRVAVLRLFPAVRQYRLQQEAWTFNRTGIVRLVGTVYRSQSEVMRKNMQLYQKNWEKIADRFFHLCDQLFPSDRWPRGRYIAYPTIWGMYPRFLEDKTFHVPYRNRNKRVVNVIIAHEMLHFFFYRYFFRTHPSLRSDRHDFFVWHVSEIFNVIAQNSPAWLKVFQEETLCYPEHQQIVARLRTRYDGHRPWTADKLIDDIVKLVQTSPKLQKDSARP